MIRVLACLVRRPDLTREAFRQHYEERHAPLARSILPPFTHYLRNHVVEGDVPFDVMTEFGYASGDAIAELNRVLASDAGDPIRADEERFMDRPKNTFFGLRALEEPGRPGLDPKARERIAILASRPSEMEAERFHAEYLERFAASVPQRVAARHWSTDSLGATPIADVVSFAAADAGDLDLAALESGTGSLDCIRVACDWSIVAEDW